jgi:protein-tyrosine phosphatase
MRICFVCQGNIIRSPLAEHIFRVISQTQGLGSKYHLESAGTSAYHIGEPPDYRMRKIAKKHGLEYSGKARQFLKEDLNRFDLIITMDKANYQILTRMAESQEQIDRIRMMREFDPQGTHSQDVPDPYYGGLSGFEETFEIVQRSCQGLFDTLESSMGGS